MIARPTHRRYSNAKDYCLYKNGKSVGVFKINEKNPDDEKAELEGFIQMTGADKVILHWSAREGFIDKEVTV